MQIETKNISAGYGNNTIISDLTLKVSSGKIVTLIGANGSGKSTILKAMARTLKTTSGGIYIDNQSLNSFSAKKLAQMLAVLPQNNSAPGDITVEELVAYGRFPHCRPLRGLSNNDQQKIEQALSLTQLTELRKRPVDQLSGGERQRAWIALNIAQEPHVLLLDEPTTFLDICHQFDILELITKMNQELKLTIFMVLHDLNMAARYSHEIVAIKSGEIYKSGDVETVLTPEILKAVFNINARVFHDSGFLHIIATGSSHSTITG